MPVNTDPACPLCRGAGQYWIGHPADHWIPCMACFDAGWRPRTINLWTGRYQDWRRLEGKGVVDEAPPSPDLARALEAVKKMG
jgi:hypothetical protein